MGLAVCRHCAMAGARVARSGGECFPWEVTDEEDTDHRSRWCGACGGACRPGNRAERQYIERQFAVAAARVWHDDRIGIRPGVEQHDRTMRPADERVRPER